jgi:hypothetical protein
VQRSNLLVLLVVLLLSAGCTCWRCVCQLLPTLVAVPLVCEEVLLLLVITSSN